MKETMLVTVIILTALGQYCSPDFITYLGQQTSGDNHS